MCVAGRIADYCDAIITTADLCKPGLKCCVSSDIYGDKIPPNLIIPNKTISNTTKTERTTNKVPFSTTTPTTTTESVKISPLNRLPSEPLKPCNGECVSGFFALFCDEIDSDADCPSDGSCCVTTVVRNV